MNRRKKDKIIKRGGYKTFADYRKNELKIIVKNLVECRSDYIIIDSIYGGTDTINETNGYIRIDLLNSLSAVIKPSNKSYKHARVFIIDKDFKDTDDMLSLYRNSDLVQNFSINPSIKRNKSVHNAKVIYKIRRSLRKLFNHYVFIRSNVKRYKVL